MLDHPVHCYLSRTADGSTLSRVVHAAVLARLDPAKAWGMFQKALTADVDDTQGGTTGHAIHLGAMVGRPTHTGISCSAKETQAAAKLRSLSERGPS